MESDHSILVVNGVDYSHAAILVMLALAGINLLFPRFVWWMRSWQYRDEVEPSESWELLVRLTSLGVILCLGYRLAHGAPNPAWEHLLKFLPEI